MCGVFGVFNARKAAEWTVIGLHGNQHRAIDYAGIVSSDGSNLYRHAGPGLARQVFADKRVLDRLHGRHAVGHIRYPTVADDPNRENLQPVMGNYGGEPFALAHNGNLTNRDELSKLLGKTTLATSMDTEYIVRLLEKFHTGDLVEDLKRVFSRLRGSYALCILMRERLVAALDPSSNRPLSVGRKDESWFVSSETCGFGGVGAEFVREIRAGEILTIEAPDGLRSWPFADPTPKKCRFEGNYFSHPSSLAFGEAVDEYRQRLGRALETAHPADADIVTPVPDSSNFIAMGYAESGRSGTYRPVIIRSHYVGRTFIAADQAKRDAEVAQKFSFTAHSIEGKRIVVVDDSVVRGTTLPKIVAELRRHGAAAVHVRIGSPPILFPCLYGINTPKKEELVSANLTKAHICTAVGADSLEFLPLEMQKQLSPDPQSFCYACMDGQYWH